MLALDQLHQPETVLNNRFKIISAINQGAQATIYTAKDMKSGNVVALKLVSDQHSNFNANVTRLKSEYNVLTALEGLEMFLKAYCLEVNAHEAYIAMEWIEDSVDGNLFIQQHRPMEFKTWLWLAKKITLAVHNCHLRKIIHRDLKPCNILFAPKDGIKIIDFGVSQQNRVVNITDADMNMGTIFYMPPELIAEGDYGISGEMFSLGVTLYEFLCGKVPFYADNPGEIMEQKLRGKFAPPSAINPDIPKWVDSLFTKLLTPSPQNRLQGTREILTLLSIRKDSGYCDEITTFHTCETCKEPLWRELTFCTHCGSIYHIDVIEGDHGLIARSVNNPDQFLKTFNKFTNNQLPGWRSHLFKTNYPRVMITGISENSAAMIAEALSDENSFMQTSLKPYIDVLHDLKLSLPQILLAGITIFFLFSGIWVPMSFATIIICLCAIAFIGIYTLIPLVSIQSFRGLSKKREWMPLSEMRNILSGISNKQIRQKASALIRRSVLLFDGIHEFNLSPSIKNNIIKHLEELSLSSLSLLVKMNNRLDVLVKYRKEGIDKKIESLETALHSSKDQRMMKRIIDRIGELSIAKSNQGEIEKQYADDEVEYSTILSELNSMYLLLIYKDIEQIQKEMSLSSCQV